MKSRTYYLRKQVEEIENNNRINNEAEFIFKFVLITFFNGMD